MQYTTNFNLKKPDGTDTLNIGDLNDNADAIDAALAKAWNTENLPLVDYIVAQGNSGGWYYRKWNSGFAECWIRATADFTSFTDHGSALYYTETFKILYPFQFTEITARFISSLNANVIAATFIGIETDGATFRAITVTNVASSYTGRNFNIYAAGKWK